jgi:hypothetical protein
MKIQVKTETLTNLEIAKQQLERAINLFLDEQDFVSSLTLAGAAEEILGKILEIEMQAPHALNELINGSLKLNGISLGDPNEKQARKNIANTLNHFKNKLKHYNDQDSMTCSFDYYAVEVIDRAIQNYFKCTSDETPLMQKFKNEVLDAY